MAIIMLYLGKSQIFTLAYKILNLPLFSMPIANQSASLSTIKPCSTSTMAPRIFTQERYSICLFTNCCSDEVYSLSHSVSFKTSFFSILVCLQKGMKLTKISSIHTRLLQSCLAITLDNHFTTLQYLVENMYQSPNELSQIQTFVRMNKYLNVG